MSILPPRAFRTASLLADHPATYWSRFGIPTAAVLLYAASSAALSMPRYSITPSVRTPSDGPAPPLPFLVLGQGLLIGRIRARQRRAGAHLLEQEGLELFLLEAVCGHRVGHRTRDAHHTLAVAHHDVARHDEHLGAADGHVLVHRHVAHHVGGRGGAERVDGKAELLHRRIVADAPVEDEAGRAAHLQARDEDVPRVRGAGHAAAIHHEDSAALDVLDGVALRIARVGQHLVARAILAGGREAYGDRLARHALVRAERPHAVQVHVAEAELEELGAERGRRDLPEPLEGVSPERRVRRRSGSHHDHAGRETLEPAVDLGLELAEETERRLVVEREHLGEENARDVPGAIDPEVGVREPRPG